MDLTFNPASFSARVKSSYENQQPVIDISASLYYSTLRFVSVNGNYKARGRFEVTIRAADSPTGQVLDTINEEYEIIASSSDQAIGYKTFIKQFNVPVSEDFSKFNVVVTNIDLQANNSQTKEYTVNFPSGEKLEMSDIILTYREGDREIQATSFDIATSADSLRFTYFINPGETEREYSVVSRIERVRSDTEYADLLWVPIQGRSIHERGVDFSNSEVVQTSTSTVLTSGIVEHTTTFSKPENGVYRFIVTLYEDDRRRSVVADASEVFIIRSPNFPAVASVREMARPLAYLMNENEYEALMQIDDTDEMKRKIDTFWLENIGESERAREVLEVYYGNVEEANILFSNFKEGWKTDMGKIYILYGSPIDIERSPNQFRWYYSLTRNPRYTFVFNRPGTFDRSLPYDHFVLMRRGIYEEEEYLRVQDWLNGYTIYRR